MTKYVNKKKLKDSYKGQGLVEALIAIVVAGIACIALMAIAAQAIQTLLESEQVDSLTQAASEGSQMAQILRDREKSEEAAGGTYIPKIGKFPACYPLLGDTTDPNIPKESGNFIKLVSRDDYVDYPIVGKYDGNIFRVLCIEEGIPNYTNAKYALVTIHTGLINCKKNPDNPDECRVDDVEYKAIINY